MKGERKTERTQRLPLRLWSPSAAAAATAAFASPVAAAAAVVVVVAAAAAASGAWLSPSPSFSSSPLVLQTSFQQECGPISQR